MYAFEAILTRRSVRGFEKKPIDDKLIGVILYAATHAPSAGNIQEWEFIVVKEDEQKKKLAKAALGQDFIAKAPIIIVVCANLARVSLKYGKRGEVLYAIQDTAFAIQNMMLAAHALGLGSCLVAFDDDSVMEILELPDNIRPVAIMPIGYSAEKSEKPRKIPFENITYSEKYGKKIKLSALQPDAKVGEGVFEPLSVYLEDAFKKIIKSKKKRKEPKKLTFEEFLRRLTR